MPTLLELIAKSKISRKEEVVACTLRMPAGLNSTVEALADQLSLSRHETLLKLVEAGADLALNALQLDKPERELEQSQQSEQRRFFLVNTNKGNNEEDHDRMLRQGVVAAFYAPWKLQIDRIGRGDVVFLYENGKGIVAYGTASGEVVVEEHEGKPDEIHYQQLEGFTVLKKPLPAAEINRILELNFVYLRVLSHMRDGQKVLDRLLAMQ